MQKVVALDEPDDFVVATGHGCRVADFAEGVFSSFGLDWRRHVVPRPNLLTKPARKYIGDAEKLYKKTGFRPKMTLPELTKRLALDLRESS
jgi:GDPmannose 4,6-dehydratase